MRAICLTWPVQCPGCVYPFYAQTTSTPLPKAHLSHPPEFSSSIGALPVALPVARRSTRRQAQLTPLPHTTIKASHITSHNNSDHHEVFCDPPSPCSSVPWSIHGSSRARRQLPNATAPPPPPPPPTAPAPPTVGASSHSQPTKVARSPHVHIRTANTAQTEPKATATASPASKPIPRALGPTPA